MQIKTANYKRTINLGNYENRVLELGAELNEGDDLNQSLADLVKDVELRVRSIDIDAEISQKKQELKELKAQVTSLEKTASKLKKAFQSISAVEDTSLELEEPPTLVIERSELMIQTHEEIDDDEDGHPY